jgi:hypothetical protein
MSGSSNTGGGNSKTTNMPPPFVIPYSKDMLAQASQLSQQPFQAYTGQRIQDFSPFQQQGFNMVQGQAQGGAGLTNMGMGSLADTVGGSYLGGNPFTDQIVNRTLGDMADQYRYATGPGNQAMASMSGSLDNSGIAGKDMMDRFSLSRAMGDAASGIRYNNYAQERQNQLGATGQALGFGQQALGNLQQAGGQQQALGQAQKDFDFTEFMRMLNEPYQGLGTLQQAVQTAQGGFGTTTGKQQSNVPNWAIGSTIGGSLMGK